MTRLLLRISVRIAPLCILAAAVASCGVMPAPMRGSATPQSTHATGLLLIHGWAGDSSAWAPVAKLLGLGGAAIDLPGHGANRQDVTGWTVANFVRAVEAERIRRGIECLVIGAHSNGAYIAREYARLHPVRAGGIVVVEGSFLKPFDGSRFASYSALIDRDWQRMQENPSGLTGAAPETVAIVRAMLRRASKNTALATFNMLAAESLWQHPAVSTPVAFLLADSPMWTEDYLIRLRAQAPGARIVRLGAVSHYAQLDRPHEVAAALRESMAQARCGGDATSDVDARLRDG